ncbi:tripartite motif-containing protein 46-like, partial [Sceloporus undulatus]|uniref:tripartite motif-containing protein 46-like n=1 Tax=Sceloporus undulatus TaxID=8520 RepID=UPI001C4AC181
MARRRVWGRGTERAFRNCWGMLGVAIQPTEPEGTDFGERTVLDLLEISSHPPTTSMKNMERELLCPMCKEMYKQPLVLPCMHNVCHICATEVLLQQGYVCPDPNSEPTSPASTPSTRSPRLGRRIVPKPERLDRLLKS